MRKTLDDKLDALRANPAAPVFILADAKDADMAHGLAAPGRSPESHAAEGRFRSLAEYREQMRLITQQAAVDIMLMSASSNSMLTIEERLFDDSTVTPAVRANDTSDIHLARGAIYPQTASRPFRTASLDHIQCGRLDCDPSERNIGANLGLYSVTFNNDIERDIDTLTRFNLFREEAERKGFRYFLEVFDPNLPHAIDPSKLAGYINDMIARMLAGVAPAGRPLFLKMVYHGPKALEELVHYDPTLIVGVLGGGAGTTRDAFQLLHDAKQYGAKVALFGRKINAAENQLAFVRLLRLIADGELGPVEAVKAYHAVLSKLGLKPTRPLADDLTLTETATSYARTGRSGAVAVPPMLEAAPAPTSNANAHACRCHEHAHTVETAPTPVAQPTANGVLTPRDGRPDFARMDVAERLAYHRKRLGLG